MWNFFCLMLVLIEHKHDWLVRANNRTMTGPAVCSAIFHSVSLSNSIHVILSLIHTALGTGTLDVHDAVSVIADCRVCVIRHPAYVGITTTRFNNLFVCVIHFCGNLNRCHFFMFYFFIYALDGEAEFVIKVRHAVGTGCPFMITCPCRGSSVPAASASSGRPPI